MFNLSLHSLSDFTFFGILSQFIKALLEIKTKIARVKDDTQNLEAFRIFFPSTFFPPPDHSIDIFQTQNNNIQ